MALPKIANPKFNITLPSTGVKVSFRPFIVKEEKILLTAKASQDETDILTAIKQAQELQKTQDTFNWNNEKHEA